MNDKGIVIFIVIMTVTLVVLIVNGILLSIDGRMDKTTRQLLKEAKRQERFEKKERAIERFYKVMRRVPFAGNYLKIVKRAYARVCPYDELYLIRVVSKTALSVVRLSLVFVCMVILLSLFVNGRMTVYSCACAVLSIYITGKELLQYSVVKLEKNLSEEIVRYISAIEMHYSAHHNIIDAISEATFGLSYEMRRHAFQLEKILMSSSRKQKVQDYVLSEQTNKYMKSLLIQAYEVSERGDQKSENGDSLFSKNMEMLRINVMRESLIREKRAFLLHGYALVALLPVFCMDLLRMFGTNYSMGLGNFYSSAGYLIMFLGFLVTLFSYSLVNKAREVCTEGIRGGFGFFHRLAEHNCFKKVLSNIETQPRKLLKKLRKMLSSCGENTPISVFVLKMIFTGAVMFVVVLAFLGMIHIQNRKNSLAQVNMDMIVVTADSKQQRLVEQTMLSMVREYRNDFSVTVDELKIEFKERISLRNDAVVDAATKEIFKNIKSYQNNYIHWYEFLLALCIGGACTYVPVLALRYRYELVLSKRDEEVKAFQSLVIMERQLPNVTVLSLLEEMETFATLYKPLLRECINYYAFAQQKALHSLKDSVKDNEWFLRLVDGLIEADNVGIAQAFKGLENNLDMYDKIEELDEEINLNKKKDRMEFIAVMPAAIILGGYLLIPFVVNAVVRLLEMLDVMEILQKGV